MAHLNINTQLALDFNDDFTDQSSNNHTVTAHNSPTFISGKFGRAVNFDGVLQHLTIPDSSSWDIASSNADDWTISAWVKFAPSGVGIMNTIVCQRENSTNAWFLSIWSGLNNDFQFELRVNGSTVIAIYKVISKSFIDLSDSNWHHIAVCKVGNKWGFYVDGTQVDYATTDSTDTYATQLVIGAILSGVGHFTGDLDDLFIEHANAFSASPNVGSTDIIVVPTVEYTYVTKSQNIILVS